MIALRSQAWLWSAVSNNSSRVTNNTSNSSNITNNVNVTVNKEADIDNIETKIVEKVNLASKWIN